VAIARVVFICLVLLCCSLSRLLILAVLGSDPVSMAQGLIHGAEDVKRGAQASCHIWQASHRFRPLLPSSISQAKRRVGIAEREGEGGQFDGLPERAIACLGDGFSIPQVSRRKCSVMSISLPMPISREATPSWFVSLYPIASPLLRTVLSSSLIPYASPQLLYECINRLSVASYNCPL